MKKYLISLLGCSLLLLWTEQLAAQYTLEVIVEGIRVEKKGVISLGIFQKGSDFPAVGAELKGVRLKVDGEEMRYRPKIGPPDFEDVAIDVTSGDQKVYINVRY